MTADADVVIGGEQQEADGRFDNAEYVADAASLGLARGYITLGHVISGTARHGRLRQMDEDVHQGHCRASRRALLDVGTRVTPDLRDHHPSWVL
jgi:hypothetical protein